MRPRDDSFALVRQQGFEAVAGRLGVRLVEADGCLEYTGYTVNGYGRVRVGGVRILAHRVAWIAANRIDPGDMLVCHSCDNRRCCNPAHLFLGTALDNVRDMDAKGRCQRVGGGRAKITAADAANIRKSSLATRALAVRYGLAESSIRNIIQGVRWNQQAAVERLVPSDLKALHNGRETSR